MATPNFIFSAPEVGTDYHVFCNFAAPESEPPLVLVLDGDDQFEPAVAAARELESRGQIPPLSLVGLGYGGSYRSPKNRRVRDYTPSQPAEEPMEGGGAEVFQRVLSQLLPVVYSKLGYTPNRQVVTGHSLSSLFGLFALAQPEPLFDGFLISSPSIWWDNRFILKTIEEAASQPITKRPVRAFFSVGEKDSPSMTGDLDLLENLLKAQPRKGLDYVVRRYAEKDHYDAFPTAFREGFAWLLKK